MAETRLLTDQLAAGNIEVTIPAGQTGGRAVIELPFDPVGCVATPRGAASGYTCSTQERDGVEEVVMSRTGSTAETVVRDVSYIAWGSDFTER